jgi:hypothetical protein
MMAILLAAAVLLVGPSAGPAQACSCVARTDQEAFTAADAVFRGQVTGYQPPPVQPIMSSLDPATWTFAVSEVFKGDVAPSQSVISAVSGASCGVGFPPQGEFLVFATRRGLDGQAHGDSYYADLCGGSRSTSAGPLVLEPGPAPVTTTAAPSPTTEAPPPAVTTIAPTVAPPTTAPVPAPAVIESQAITQAPEPAMVATATASAAASDGSGDDVGVGLAVVAAGAMLGGAAVGVLHRTRRRRTAR